MMQWFFFAIYVGGAFRETDVPIGFFRRLFWPMHLGDWIANLADPTNKRSDK